MIKKIYVLPAALDRNHPLHVGYVGKEDKMGYSVEDIVMVPTKCEKCGVDGSAPTFKQILEKEGSILKKILDEKGYVDVICNDCKEKATDE
jgi:predicted nucleic-acid-binding Zn-ribbon protein